MDKGIPKTLVAHVNHHAELHLFDLRIQLALEHQRHHFVRGSDA
jgi:hypothetical protein